MKKTRILPRVQLFRSLFPSWRFFDRPGEPYWVEVCWNPESSQAWERLFLPPDMRWWNLFLNPHVNLAMAWQSLVETLALELEEASGDFERASVSYQLIQNGIESCSRGRSFQFRLRCGEEVLLLSPGTKT